ncbi:MAG: hypothetical protein U0271_41395 [Polyangiaceae bacterium]
MNRTLPVIALAFVAAACSGPKKVYEKKSPPTGKAAAIPQPPNLPKKAKKEADGSYTVTGLTHDLRSIVLSKSVDGKDLSVTGYIVKTNMVACKDDKNAIEEDCTPKCAVHEKGKGDDKGDDIKDQGKAPPGKAPAKDAKDKPKADEPECIAPVPAFWIAETNTVTDTTELIKVVDWATNFAGIYSAIVEYDKESDPEKRAAIKVDDSYGKTIPNPIPAVGAKVKITGKYGKSYDMSTSTIADPRFGIMAARSIEVVEQAPELGSLPYMDPRKKPKDKDAKK